MFNMHWLLGKLIIFISFRFVLSPEDAEQDLISFLNKSIFPPFLSLSFLSPSCFYEKKQYISMLNTKNNYIEEQLWENIR